MEYPEECEALGQHLLIHVTSFFRDPEAFEALKQHVLPERFRDRRSWRRPRRSSSPPTPGHRRMLLDARKSESRELGTQHILLAITDVTGQT